jgi:shikimate dehydrogenase
MVDDAMRCAVLGRPIEHSLSPALHRAAYEVLGLHDWTYDRFEVGAEQLADFVAGCGPSWRGLSLTMPLKEAVLRLGEPDPVAIAVNAGNTLIFEPGRPRVYNTDVEGLVSALRRAGLEQAERVIILGSGATARSAVASARDIGAQSVVVAARRLERARPVTELAEQLGLSASVLAWGEALPDADLLISTVTAGAVVDDETETGAAAVARSAPVIFDAVYHPWPSPLASAAAAAGKAAVSGLDLLIGQAVGQIRLMTGADLDPEVLYRAGREALSDRSNTAGSESSA